MSKVDPAVEQAVDTLGLNPITRRRLLKGTGLASATLAASALLAACGSDEPSGGSAAAAGSGDFPSTPKWKFVFVNHVTTNPFFTPTQYGAQDACALLNCEFQFTGSKESNVAEMVNATNTAISGKADGAAQAIKDSGKPIKFTAVGTNADVTRGLSIIDAYAQGHSNLAGMLAVDAGSTQSVGQVVEKYSMRDKGLKVAGGFDLVPETLAAIDGGSLDYTIDQQPYLQGFLPVLYLYLYKLSGGLLFPSETNTGLLFVTKDNVKPYLDTKTRFEGSSTEQQVVPRSGAIAHA